MERNLQVGIVEDPSNALIFVIQVANPNNEALAQSQVDAARNAAKSVFEITGATVFACSDAIVDAARAGVLSIVANYPEEPLVNETRRRRAVPEDNGTETSDGETDGENDGNK